MTKRLGFLFILILAASLLVGCNASKQTLVNEYNADTDYPYTFYSQEPRITESDKGYYMLNGDYIYFMDKQSTKPVLLDNRPDHECMTVDTSTLLTDDKDENCNAYVTLDMKNSVLFQFYQDSLYTIEYKLFTEVKDPTDGFRRGEYELVKRDPDGSNRKVLKTFPNAKIWQAGIHRGQLYYVVEDYDKDQKLNYQILRLSLKKLSKEPEVVYKGQYENGSIQVMIPYGAQIYFDESPGNGDMSSVMRYDINSSSVSHLWDLKDGGYPTLDAIHNNKLYLSYFYYDKTARDTSYLLDERGLKTYTSDLDGSNISETDIQSTKVRSPFYIDDYYTYVRPDWVTLWFLKDAGEDGIPDEMKIYKDGELIHTVDTSHPILQNSIYTGDERYMFVQGQDENNFSFILYLDKNEIESGSATFKTLVETPWK